MSDALKIVTHEDAAPAKKRARIVKQNIRNEADPNRLMDMLGDIDGLKHEIQERVKRIEAVKQARTLLMEDAERTEALNRRLAEFGRVMTAAQSGVLVDEEPEAELPRKQPREAHSEIELLLSPVRASNEGVAIAWPRPADGLETGGDAEQIVAIPDGEVQPGETQPSEIQPAEVQPVEIQPSEIQPVETQPVEFQLSEIQLSEVQPAEVLQAEIQSGEVQPEKLDEATQRAVDSALERLEQAEASWSEARKQADEVTAEAKRLIEESTLQLNRAVSREEEATVEFQSAREALTAAFESSNQRLEEAESHWKHAELAAQEAARLHDDARSRFQAALSQGEAENGQLSAVAREAIDSALESLLQAEESQKQAWQRTDEAAIEARRLLDESTAQFNRAVAREEKAAADFRSAQETLTNVFETSKERADEAERCWRQAETATLEAKGLLEETTAKLNRALVTQEKAAAELQTAQQTLAANYQSANQRYEEAEKFWKGGNQSSTDAREMLQKSEIQLAEARTKEETAAFDLNSARQELTTAYQFAAVAAQRRLDSVHLFKNATRWTILSIAFAWIATVWFAWFALRPHVNILVAGLATAVLLIGAFMISKRVTEEA